MELKINKKEYLDWLFNDKENVPYYIDILKDNLEKFGKFKCSLEDSYKYLGYLPSHLIIESDKKVEKIIKEYGEYYPNSNDIIEFI